ncbi:hypothetical protein ACFL3V_04440 [Nanoarchaeota archaeon]
MKEISPEELMNDLLYAQKLKDGRLFALLIHLHTEYFVNQLCKVKSIKEPNIPNKARRLHEEKVLGLPYYQAVLLINDIRNKLVHRLRPDLAEIEDMINNERMEMQADDPILLEALNTSTAWAKLNLIAVPLIFALYKKLKELKNEPLEQNMHIELQPSYNWRFVFKKLDKKSS